MTVKAESYDELISEKLAKEPEFAREVLLHAIECGDSVQKSLRDVITRMGTESFSRISNSPLAEVDGFINADSANINLVEKYLAILGCELTAKVSKRQKAA